MQRYVAFLRAINVGGRTVKMGELRAMLASLGLGNVETFIASGNVAFDASGGAAALEQRVERHLSAALGYEVATFVRSLPELAAVAAYEPFGAPDPLDAGHALSIAFLKTAPAAATRRRLAELCTATDELHVHGRELYWLYRRSVGESTISGARLERAIGGPATVRNVTTVRKMAAKYWMSR